MRFVFLALFLTACASHNLNGDAHMKNYAVPYDKLWAATRTSVIEGGLNLYSEDKAKGEMLASKGKNWVSFGENVTINVKKIDNQTTSLKIVTTPVVSYNITARNWEAILYPLVEEKLNK